MDEYSEVVSKAQEKYDTDPNFHARVDHGFNVMMEAGKQTDPEPFRPHIQNLIRISVAVGLFMDEYSVGKGGELFRLSR